MKPVEIIYAGFCLAAFAAAVFLMTVTWIQYHHDRNTNISNPTGNSSFDIRHHNAKRSIQGSDPDRYRSFTDQYEYPGYSRTMGCEPDMEGFGNFILPNDQWIGPPGLRRTQANPRSTWGPAYHYPWRKSARPGLRDEPYIQGAKKLYA